MPTKHIAIESWDIVTRTTLAATIKNQAIIRETQVMDYLIKKGAKNLTDKDLRAMAGEPTYRRQKPAKAAKAEKTEKAEKTAKRQNKE
jgi:hypothetical protein